MSYILDALKKSDHERKQGTVPGLQTVHIPVSIESSASRWPYFFIVFLLLSLAFVLGMLRPWDAFIETSENKIVKEKNSTEALIDSASNTQKELVILKTQSQLIQSSPETPVLMQQVEPLKIESSQIVKKAAPLIEHKEKVAASIEIDSVPHLYDMPPLVQQAIPDMSFAGHVYSSEASQRSIIVNGHSMSEGEVIIEGLKVEQITRNGVVFNYQGQLFRMEVLQDWSFD